MRQSTLSWLRGSLILSLASSMMVSAADRKSWKDITVQVGDIKIEFNLEYRFNFNARLSAAVFTDAGNVWLLKPDPYRPLGEIRWGKITDDSYLTAGVGLRLDITFLVIRADYGAVLYAPFFEQGQKWLWENKMHLWGPVFGFGLPF